VVVKLIKLDACDHNSYTNNDGRTDRVQQTWNSSHRSRSNIVSYRHAYPEIAGTVGVQAEQIA
jgi:hypothetical protein